MKVEISLLFYGYLLPPKKRSWVSFSSETHWDIFARPNTYRNAWVFVQDLSAQKYQGEPRKYVFKVAYPNSQLKSFIS